MAGVLLVAMGVARLGNLIEYIPYPVTTGFTTGIATVIATLQIKDALGLQTGPLPEHFVAKLGAFWDARATAHAGELAIAVVTFALLRLLPRVTRKVPAPLLAIAGVTAAVALIGRFVPELQRRDDRHPLPHDGERRRGRRHPVGVSAPVAAVGRDAARATTCSASCSRRRSRSRCWAPSNRCCPRSSPTA